ncbi:photoreceptor ankyrin repeat protein [Conger conger]|uniref:photoreceptor ankyrin repeat protein n=1 Tax=Conger conger TaxID=82655 RepID=UPI002A5AD39C|nr:photoreceptor ankyrin repeat protein [Conger conger]
MAAVRGARVAEDPHLGTGPDEDALEASISGRESDSDSVFSEDSVLPHYEQEERRDSRPASTLYEACAWNQVHSLHAILERGVTQEEVMELDANGWNGLMVAVSKGFVDIVIGLHHCPFLDINHQDNDGNTALMMAAQAGYIITLNYILNYYAGADTEVRDSRGFTALIKAAMQGRNECVAALVMAGADLSAVDTARGKCARDWALKTGRYDTLYRLRRLKLRPRAEQFGDAYAPEWPELQELVAKAAAAKTRGERITQRLKSTFAISLPHDPRDGGVLDHMVRMTTGLRSPLVCTGCRPLRPTSPPSAGKRRLAVPELARQHPGRDLTDGPLRHSVSASASVGSGASDTVACCVETERRGSVLSLASNGARNFLPRSRARRNSVFPTGCIPQIRVTRSGEPTPKKEKKKHLSRHHLEPPKWRYKEIKQEKKKKKAEMEKEEEEKKKKKKSRK